MLGKGKCPFSSVPGSSLGKDVQKQRRTTHDCGQVKGTIEHSSAGNDQ